MDLLDLLKSTLSRRILFHKELLIDKKDSSKILWWPRLVKRERYKAQNRESIKAFRVLLFSLFGSKRVERICLRYNINLEKLEKKGKPLKERHIAKVLAGAADISMQDIEELIEEIQDSFQKTFRKLTTLQVAELNDKFKGVKHVGDLNAEQLQLAIDLLMPPQRYRLKVEKEISPNPTQFWAYLFHDKLLMDLERQELQLEASTLTNKEAYFELLCKSLAYREMKKGTLVAALISPTGQQHYYKVASTIVTHEGMVAYGLLPATNDMDDLDPIILFRGSLFIPSGLNAISSYITDLEKNLGKSAYLSGRHALQEFLKHTQGKPILVMGHSLGGNLAQWFTSDHPEVVKTLYTFNAPGLPKEVVRRFAQRVESLQNPLQIKVYRTKGDIVHIAGDRHLGQGCNKSFVSVSLIEFRPDKSKHCKAHQSRFLKENRFFTEPYIVDDSLLEQELTNHHRYTLERFRKYGGGYLLSYILRFMRLFTKRTSKRIREIE